MSTLIKLIELKCFLLLFVLGLVSNASFLVYDRSVFAVLCMIGIAAVVALGETFFISVAKKIKVFLGKIFLVLISGFHAVVIFVDYFLITNFRMVCNQDVVDIIAETNHEQTVDFLQTYLNVGCLAPSIVCVILCFVLAFLLIKVSVKFNLFWLAVALSIVGIGCLGRMSYCYIMYHNGLSVPQYVAPMRIAYSLNILNHRLSEIKRVKLNCSLVRANSALDSKPNVVVIVGESFNKYHSSLYGYEKKTNPLLQELMNDSSLIVFSDVVAIADVTHRNMKAVFSMSNSEKDFFKYALFPAYFKSAGYKTILFDNQYLLGQGITFLSDKELSSVLFDFRNTNGYSYDGDLVKDIPWQDNPSLYIIHLWGQHYSYANRYPHDEFSKFNPMDYSQFSDKSKAEIVSHYDNACLYNDYVVREIIRKLENQNSIVFYFSDHGEEVYDVNDFMGHGTSVSTSDMKYQIEVPFMVWISPEYNRLNSELVEKIKAVKDTRILIVK